MLALTRSAASRWRTFAFSRGYASKRKTVKEHPNAQSLTDALHVLKAVEAGRPMHQYEIHVQCKIEKSTPLIRGSVMLPKGLKDEAKVLVFAEVCEMSFVFSN
jgi:large subunit ribosomal protein L1